MENNEIDLSGTYFYDPDIITTPQYQVYGLNKPQDTEAQNYTFDTNELGSEIIVGIIIDETRDYKESDLIVKEDDNPTPPPGVRPKPDQGGKEIKYTELPEGTEISDGDPAPDGSESGDIYYIRNRGVEDYTFYKVAAELSEPTVLNPEGGTELPEWPEAEQGEDPILDINGICNEELFYVVSEYILDENATIIRMEEETDGEEGDGKGRGDNGPESTRDGDIIIDKEGEEREILPGIIIKDNKEDDGDIENVVYADFEDPNKFIVSSWKNILVNITPNPDMVENYPNAIVTINGKTHDLAYLERPIVLYTDKNYRISINWVWGELVETFRIICNQ